MVDSQINVVTMQVMEQYWYALASFDFLLPLLHDVASSNVDPQRGLRFRTLRLLHLNDCDQRGIKYRHIKNFIEKIELSKSIIYYKLGSIYIYWKTIRKTCIDHPVLHEMSTNYKLCQSFSYHHFTDTRSLQFLNYLQCQKEYHQRTQLKGKKK
jgi:hypothetical protein